jgi:hypothetical protein
MATRTDFSSTSSPTKLPQNQQDRSTVASRTNTPATDRNTANKGYLENNPRHAPASRLESVTGGSRAYQPQGGMFSGGSPRNEVNHQNQVNRQNYHANFGTPKKGSMIRTARGYQKAK